MKLLQMHAGRHCKVLAVSDERAGVVTYPVVEFIKDQPKERSGSAKGFRAVFMRYAETGTQDLTTALFHEANKEEKIWEFIKGSLRIYCFIDSDNKAVVLSAFDLKTTKKTPSAIINEVVRVRDRYLQAVKENKIEIIENIKE